MSMPASNTVHFAGYQGEQSILTAALRALAVALGSDTTARWNLPVGLEADVTAKGEKATALFASLESGERQIGYMASSYLSARVPELAVLDLPFSVSDRAQALAALDGPAGTMLRQAVAAQTGLEVLAFWDNGFRHISNAVRPIRRPADCQGLRIRTLDSAQYRALLDALGFKALSIDVKDLVHAVQTGAVQAQENPLTNLLSFGLWRHHKHVSLTGHLFGVLLLVCPRAWLQGLQPAQRAALMQAVERATQQQRQAAAQEDARALAELQTLGVAVLQASELDRNALQAACAALSESQRRTLPTALVQAYLNHSNSPASHGETTALH
jgi:TRAP-type transport system periplasmic protein